MTTLNNTIFSWVYDCTWSTDDEDLFNKISITMALFVLGSIAINVFGPVPYGKTAGNSKVYIWSYKLSSQFVWRYGFIATIIMPIIMICTTPCARIGHFCNATGLAIHSIHYFNRTIIYPSRISKKATPQTVWFFLLIVLITTVHGFIQSHHLLNVHVVNVSYLTYIGIVCYIIGAIINLYHDNILINLRESSTNDSNGESHYKIPRGALFEYVSCANYFGELLEWWGFFLVTIGYPQLLFATFSTTFLGSRALFAHKFYKEKFGSAYPSNRKAIIPFIL